MKRGFAFFLASIAAAKLLAAEKVFDFTTDKVGASPNGWSSVLVGSGKPGDWQVLLDDAPNAASVPAPGAAGVFKRPVIAQLSTDPTDERFPVLVYDGDKYGDFTLTLQFKLMSGAAEQMAGVVFRYQDERNFYVVRASGLGGNVRFYRVAGGERGRPIGPEIPITRDVWHELTVEAVGNKFRIRLNGREAIPELSDSTFGEGKIGLWTKSDSVSYFTDLRLNYSARENQAGDLVRDALQRYPRLLDLRIYATSSLQADLHVVASKNAEDLGKPAGETEKDVIARNAPFAGKGGGRYVVTLPLHDLNGDPIAAVRVDLDTFPGQTADNAAARALNVVKRMESKVTTLRELTR
jgi:hypothetical protein